MEDYSNEAKTVEMKKRKLPIGVIIGIFAVIVSAGVILATSMLVSGDSKKNPEYEEKMDLGRRYLEELNYEQAILAFNEAIGIDPKNEEAYLELAKVYEQMGDYDMLVETLDKAEQETGSTKVKRKKDRVEKTILAEREKNPEEEPESEEKQETEKDRELEEKQEAENNREPEEKQEPEKNREPEETQEPEKNREPEEKQETEKDRKSEEKREPQKEPDKEPKLGLNESDEEKKNPIRIISAEKYGKIEKYDKTNYCKKCGKVLEEYHVEAFQLNNDYSDHAAEINEILMLPIDAYKDNGGDNYYDEYDCEDHSSEYYDASYDNLYVANVYIYNERYLLITYAWDWYGGGAHGDYGHYQKIYDLKKGEVAGLKDVFNGTEEEFKKLIAQKTKEDCLKGIREDGYNRYSFYENENEVYKAAYENAGFGNSNIIISDENVEIFYDHYEMGSYADGVFEIYMPLEDFFGSEGNENDSDRNKKDMEYYKKILYNRDTSEGVSIRLNKVAADYYAAGVEFGLYDINGDGRKELYISGTHMGSKEDYTIIVCPAGNEYKEYMILGNMSYISDKGFLVRGSANWSDVEDVYMITSDGDLVQKYGFDIWNARDWDNDGIYVENSRSVYRLENDVKFDISEDEFYKVLEEYRLTKETAVDELKYWDLSDDNIEKYIK